MVDAAGVMLGPKCVLVRRTASGFLCLEPAAAAAIEDAILVPGHAPGHFFDELRRIAEALNRGELALRSAMVRDAQ